MMSLIYNLIFNLNWRKTKYRHKRIRIILNPSNASPVTEDTGEMDTKKFFGCQILCLKKTHY